jgi:hypothetical protein
VRAGAERGGGEGRLPRGVERAGAERRGQPPSLTKRGKW